MVFLELLSYVFALQDGCFKIVSCISFPVSINSLDSTPMPGTMSAPGKEQEAGHFEHG